MNDSRSLEYSSKTEAKPGRGECLGSVFVFMPYKRIVHACSECTCSCLVDCNESICQFEKKIKRKGGCMFIEPALDPSMQFFHLSPFVSETHFDIVTHEC